MQGTCPTCNTENFTYFGDILTVSGSRSETTVPCKECKSQLKFKAEDRMVSSHTLHWCQVSDAPYTNCVFSWLLMRCARCNASDDVHAFNLMLLLAACGGAGGRWW